MTRTQNIENLLFLLELVQIKSIYQKLHDNVLVLPQFLNQNALTMDNTHSQYITVYFELNSNNAIIIPNNANVIQNHDNSGDHDDEIDVDESIQPLPALSPLESNSKSKSRARVNSNVTTRDLTLVLTTSKNSSNSNDIDSLKTSTSSGDISTTPKTRLFLTSTLTNTASSQTDDKLVVSTNSKPSIETKTISQTSKTNQTTSHTNNGDESHEKSHNTCHHIRNQSIQSAEFALTDLMVDKRGHVGETAFTYLFDKNGSISEKIVLPVGLPISRILLASDNLFDQMVTLHEKYIKNGANFQLNISHQMRQFLDHFFGTAKANLQTISTNSIANPNLTQTKQGSVGWHSTFFNSDEKLAVNLSVGKSNEQTFGVPTTRVHHHDLVDSVHYTYSAGTMYTINDSNETDDKEINLNSKLNQESLKYLTKLNRFAFNVFDEIALELISLMHGPFLRFIATDEFKQYMLYIGDSTLTN